MIRPRIDGKAEDALTMLERTEKKKKSYSDIVQEAIIEKFNREKEERFLRMLENVEHNI